MVRFALKSLIMPWRILILGLLLAVVCSSPAGPAQAPSGGTSENQIKVAMFIPRPDSFWETNVRYARAAAQDLGLELEIIDFHDNAGVLLKNIERICREGVSGIIFPSFGNAGETVLEMAEIHRTPAFMINSDIKGADFPPRTKYRFWLGKMVPDDYSAGATLMQQLLSMADKAGMTRYNVLCIEGRPDEESSIQRRLGVEHYIKYDPRVVSFTVAAGNWDPNTAAALFKKYYKENPDINLVWCANDNMALAVADAVKELDIEEPIFIGGMDWDPRALIAIGEGRLQVSVGGHFIEGAWAVTMLYDYLKGVDFSSEGLSFTTSMDTITKDNLDTYSHFLDLDPDEIDFRQYSKAYNPARTKYTLDLADVAKGVLVSKGRPQQLLELTAEEKAFLRSHPKITLGVMEAWPPMDFVDQSGRPSGIGADYAKYLEETLGIKLELVPGPFQENLEATKAKKLDALMDVTPKPEREEFLNFTRAYLDIPHVIVAREDGPYYATESDLDGKTLALEEGFYSVKYFRDKYPKVKIKEFGTTSLALDAVSRGRADAYAGNRAVAVWLMEQEVINNLQVQGRLNKSGSILTIGVRKDWPELASIFDKALATMPMEDVRTIRRRWAGFSEEETGDRRPVLTETDKEWLSAHKELRLGVSLDWPPFEFTDDQGNYVGITSEYVNWLNQTLGIKMNPLTGLSWSEVLQAVQRGDIDLIPAIVKTKEREEHLIFTRPYLKVPLVVITRNDADYLESLDKLAGKKVAVIRGFLTRTILENKHPDIVFIELNTPEDALRAVADGDAYATISNVAVLDYHSRSLGLDNLKVAAPTPYALDLSFAVRKDMPELGYILDKALASISEKDKAVFHERWANIRIKRQVDWMMVVRLVVSVILIAAIIMAVIMRWNRILKREVAERTVAEQKIQAMSAAIHDALIMIDSKSTILFWNQAAENIFGYTAEEALGKHMHGLFAPEEYREAAAKGLREFARTGQGPAIGSLLEYQALRRDGSAFPAEIAISAFQVDEVWFAVGMVRDITERKQIEEQIKAAREELLLIFDNSQVGIMFMQGDCELARVNRSLADILGYDSPRELIGFNMSRLHLSEQSFLSFKASNHEVLLQGRQSRIEYQLRRKDGSAVWCSMSGNAVDTANPPDLNKGVIWVIDDITDRKRAEDALREAEEQNRLILENAGDGIFGIDTNGCLLFINKAACDMLGICGDSILGKNVHELIHHSHGDGSPYPDKDCPMTFSYKEGTTHHITDEVLWRKDGTCFYVEYTSTPIYKDEHVVGAVITFREVTERREAEEKLREYMEDLERFNRLVIGREVRMIELKSEINDLMKQMGQEEKYRIVE